MTQVNNDIKIHLLNFWFVPCLNEEIEILMATEPNGTNYVTWDK